MNFRSLDWCTVVHVIFRHQAFHRLDVCHQLSPNYGKYCQEWECESRGKESKVKFSVVLLSRWTGNGTAHYLKAKGFPEKTRCTACRHRTVAFRRTVSLLSGAPTNCRARQYRAIDLTGARGAQQRVDVRRCRWPLILSLIRHLFATLTRVQSSGQLFKPTFFLGRNPLGNSKCEYFFWLLSFDFVCWLFILQLKHSTYATNWHRGAHVKGCSTRH